MAAKNVSKTVQNRKIPTKNTKGEIVKWSAEAVATGAAADAVLNEFKQIGAGRALGKERGSFENAFSKAASGSEFAGREGMNKTLGIGDKWSKMSNQEQIALMSKVQDNAGVSAIGGITAAHKMVEKAGSVDTAIEAGNVLAAEKAIQSVAHADNLTKTFGKTLKAQMQKLKRHLAKKQIKTLKKLKKVLQSLKEKKHH